MDWMKIIERIDPATARAFVAATRNVIDALLLEGERVRQAQGPAVRDYAAAELRRDAPAGGWISDEELRATGRRLAEALAAEKWVDGFAAAVKIMALLGGAA